jgi:FecR-like protein
VRINKKIALEFFALILSGAYFSALAAQEAKAPQTPAQSSAGSSPVESLGTKSPAAPPPPAAENASQFSPQYIGRVIRFAPGGTTQHPGVPGENLLHLGELIEQGEQIETDFYGRAQIQLFDGPALNLGSLSTMRIVAYDPQSQQIRVEVSAGSVSVDRAGSASPASNMQVETTTALLGGSGSFVAYDPPRFTDVCEVNGVATVRNANPAVSGEVTLHSGECTRVVLNKPPTPPKKAPKVIRGESRFTSVAGLPNDDKIFPPRNP